MLTQWDGNMLWVVPLQFEAVASRRLGNGGSDLVGDAFSDEIECAFIGSYYVHGQRAVGVGDEHRPEPRNYHYRFRVGEGHFLNRSNRFRKMLTHRGESMEAIDRRRAIMRSSMFCQGFLSVNQR